MDSLKKFFGQRVKELRKSQNLTQEQLAEKIEMDTQNLCKMENGNHFPQTKNLDKIAKALNVDIKELFEYEHFNSKEKLINEIIEYVKSARQKDIEFIYKAIKSLKEYNK